MSLFSHCASSTTKPSGCFLMCHVFHLYKLIHFLLNFVLVGKLLVWGKSFFALPFLIIVCYQQSGSEAKMYFNL